MKYKITDVRIGKRAQKQFEKQRQNIEDHYGIRVANKYIDDFDTAKEQIKKTPKRWVESEAMPGARRALFSKYGAFLYRVYTKFIRIVAIYDTRQNKYPKR